MMAHCRRRRRRHRRHRRCRCRRRRRCAMEKPERFWRYGRTHGRNNFSSSDVYPQIIHNPLMFSTNVPC
jgi:hypothetical protein